MGGYTVLPKKSTVLTAKKPGHRELTVLKQCLLEQRKHHKDKISINL